VFKLEGKGGRMEETTSVLNEHYIVVYMLFARGSGGTLNAVDGKKRWVVVGIVLR
jgi:hypothetical protein